MRLQERLLRSFAHDHPAEAAALLGAEPPEAAAEVLARLPGDVGSALLERTSPALASGMLSCLDTGPASGLLDRLPLERGAGVLRLLEPEERERLLAALPKADQLRSLIAYPRNTAGGLMDPSVPALRAGLDADEVRHRLGRLAAHLAIELYVVDAEQRLIGVADLRELLDPSRSGTLGSLSRPVEPLDPGADLTSLGAHPGWLHHGTLPVVDDHGTYLGAVRAERVRQLAQEEATRRSRGGADAVLALGELFWLGLTGLFSSLAAPRAEEER
jgi:Mg/Co/Ni transporter MgtE